MALTPDEILNHEFTRKGSRAYVAREVDSFLDEVNNDYRALIADYEALQKKSRQQQEHIDELEGQKNQVNESIMFAQSAASRLRSETEEEVKSQLEKAQQEAKEMLDNARTKAEEESKRLAQENVDLVNEQNRLRERVAAFKNSFLSLLDDQKALLQEDKLAEAIEALPESMISQKALDNIASEDSEETVELPTDLKEIPDFAKGPIEKKDAAVPSTTEPASKVDADTEKPADPTVVVFPESEEK
ncbi:DivIVA domain-containing protein [Fructobacillus papyrifericola]|uniref:DivIVA domain-containing protein n=1 Tax=Fructobacillus papyrifericola TaxID=2713172 RepID=A0ABS5QTE2_9LACO|nr:DivIVA domain-containing protein [Fructobacillus papyrifericola]MBS9336202.1 DivIVA domain-containing protein [Fructobacillus papyrifericola]